MDSAAQRPQGAAQVSSALDAPEPFHYRFHHLGEALVLPPSPQWTRRFAVGGPLVADLVLVHGMGAQRSSRLEHIEIWRAALAKGLSNVRARTIYPDLEFAFYGHLYNDGKAGDGPLLRISDLSPGFEQDFAVAMANSLCDGPAAEPDKLDVPGSLQWAMRLLERHQVMDGVQASIIRYIKQVNRYLTDVAFKRKVWTEMSAAMATRPRAVVAHSLGTVVAYDWLRSNPNTTASSFITLGSPLGFRGVRKLHLGLDGSPAPWPNGVTTWLNVAAKRDPVAMVKVLNGLFGGTIDDKPGANRRGAAHDAMEYLQNCRTAEGVAKALG